MVAAGQAGGKEKDKKDLIVGKWNVTEVEGMALPEGFKFEIEFTKDGKIKAIAVTSAKRSALLPKVPTLAESGYPGLEMDTWLALVAPRGLTPAVKSRLEQALAQAVSDPETLDKMIAVGFEPAYASSKAVAELIDKELPLMRAIAQRAGITAD